MRAFSNFSLVCLLLVLLSLTPATAQYSQFDLSDYLDPPIDPRDTKALNAIVESRLASNAPVLPCLSDHLSGPSDASQYQSIFSISSTMGCGSNGHLKDTKALIKSIGFLALALELSGSGVPSFEAQYQIFNDVVAHGVDLGLATPSMSLILMSHPDNTDFFGSRSSKIHRAASLALAYLVAPDIRVSQKSAFSLMNEVDCRASCDQINTHTP
ncbi:hypothetical protein [Aliiroseovarius sp.]|uniref:hypothetical protein n=1 Tax=Aliiroseovarius sp. TaxID=1872442 RepID=UPI003BA8C653